MSTSAIVPTPHTGGTTGTTGTTNGLPSGQSLNNMFLQLLVAQLQNQDPTAPVDPSQFVGQLAQFSELSEVTSIYTLLQQVVPTSSSTGSGTTGSGGTGASGSVASGSGAAAAGAATSAALAQNPLATSIPAAASSLSPSANFASPTISALAAQITSKIQGAF